MLLLLVLLLLLTRASSLLPGFSLLPLEGSVSTSANNSIGTPSQPTAFPQRVILLTANTMPRRERRRGKLPGSEGLANTEEPLQKQQRGLAAAIISR